MSQVFEPRALPAAAQRLCDALAAPALLVAHLRLVHDAAVELLEGLQEAFPGLRIDREAVLFGTATHDLGKALHPGELTGPGRRHEDDGPALLERQGVPPELARFARTHGASEQEPGLTLEDLLVRLADTIWKGRRDEALEAAVVARIAAGAALERWEAYAALDQVIDAIGADAERRLAWARK